MTAANAHLMSGRTDAAPPERSAHAPRTWPEALGDAAAFALVGIAVVGFVVETLDRMTDNLPGVLQVTTGAAVGAIASAIYGRVETRSDRLARARVLAWSFVRFFVAFELMRYGAAKIVGMQFYPQYYRLDTRPADLTPMGLAWTFFGRVYGYQAATGVLEITAAVLLCFRRTATLGACVLLAVMANVVLMDFFYDVPVRLFSSIYLLMGLYVLSPDARRFWAFFLSDGPVPARAFVPAVTPSSFRRMATAFVIALVIVLPSADIVHKAHQRGIFRKDALEGAWTVEQHAGLDVQGTPGTWEKLYFEKGEYGFLRIAGKRVPFKTDIDERARTMRLFEIGNRYKSQESSGGEVSATYTLEGARLHVEGVREGAPFSMDLVRDLPR